MREGINETHGKQITQQLFSFDLKDQVEEMNGVLWSDQILEEYPYPGSMKWKRKR